VVPEVTGLSQEVPVSAMISITRPATRNIRFMLTVGNIDQYSKEYFRIFNISSQ